ncbi:MAG: hypothetical protein AABW59_00720 [archaeon]
MPNPIDRKITEALLRSKNQRQVFSANPYFPARKRSMKEPNNILDFEKRSKASLFQALQSVYHNTPQMHYVDQARMAIRERPLEKTATKEKEARKWYKDNLRDVKKGDYGYVTRIKYWTSIADLKNPSSFIHSVTEIRRMIPGDGRGTLLIFPLASSEAKYHYIKGILRVIAPQARALTIVTTKSFGSELEQDTSLIEKQLRKMWRGENNVWVVDHAATGKTFDAISSVMKSVGGEKTGKTNLYNVAYEGMLGTTKLLRNEAGNFMDESSIRIKGYFKSGKKPLVMEQGHWLRFLKKNPSLIAKLEPEGLSRKILMRAYSVGALKNAGIKPYGKIQGSYPKNPWSMIDIKTKKFLTNKAALELLVKRTSERDIESLSRSFNNQDNKMKRSLYNLGIAMARTWESEMLVKEGKVPTSLSSPEGVTGGTPLG